MMVGKPRFVMMIFKIIGRQADQYGWDGDEGTHKGYDRKHDQADPHFFGNPRFGKLNELINHGDVLQPKMGKSALVSS
jgi:hypothetical protein